MLHRSFLRKGSARKDIYLSLFLRSLALAVIGIFVPGYLLSLKFSLATVLLYELVLYLTFLVSSPIGAEVTKNWGFKKAVLVASIISSIHYVLLYFAKDISFTLFPNAVLGGFAAALYWIPMNSHFARHTDKFHVAEESGYLNAVSYLAGIFGPLAGGLIITYLGFSYLYTIGVGFLILSVAPLFHSKDYAFPFQKNWERTFTKENLSYLKTFAFQGIFSMCAGLVFPIFVYVKTASFQTTGFIIAIQGIGTAVAAIIAGKLADKVGKHWTLRTFAFLNTLVWITAVFAKTPLQLYILSMFIGLFTVFFEVAIFGIFCDNVREKDSKLSEHVVYREIGLNIGRAIIFIAMLFFIPFAFELAFIVSALSAIYFVFAKI